MMRQSMVFTVCCLFAGCGSEKDTTPTDVVANQVAPVELTESFMGHWTSDRNDHLYFGPLGTDGLLGSFCLVQSGRPDQPFFHQYEIVDRSDEGVMLKLHFSTVDKTEERLHKVDETGQALTIVSTPEYLDRPVSVTYTRVDDAIAPSK